MNTVPAETDRIVRGSIHRMTTAKGSTLMIDNTVDQYGRCSSHAITATNAKGYDGWYARNVSARDVPRLVRLAESQGYRHVSAFREAF